MLLLRKIRVFHKIVSQSCAFISTRMQQIKLKEYGDLENGVFVEDVDLSSSSLQKGQVLVKLIGAPVNPADINIIQGKYASLPKSLPANIGNEGLFEVVESNESKRLNKGDWVLPTKIGWGTWRSHSIENEDSFVKIPNNLDKYLGASLSVNPCTAYRMLKDFRTIAPGETIIQNGANSGVGQAVIQFSKALGINVINIVRKRDNLDELYSQLRSLGAKYILTEEDLRKATVTNELWKEIPRPKFALNCVGGKITVDMVRLLDSNSIMVTYGGMSQSPLTLNTGDFIFKDFTCRGFWLTEWRKRNLVAKYEEMLQQVLDLIKKTDFKAQSYQEFKLSEYKEAFKNTKSKFLVKKSLFVN